MDYSPNVTGVRQLDDELLAALEQKYLDSATSPERLQLLQLRLRRVRGKFAIYTICFTGSLGNAGMGPRPAAAVVRELVKVLANDGGAGEATLPGWVSAEPDLLPSAKARVVKTKSGPIYVATNLSRDAAEWLMAVLLQRLPEGDAWIGRAGDRFLESGPSANSHIVSRNE